MTFDSSGSAEPIAEPAATASRPKPAERPDWRTTEVAVLRALYPTGGAAAVQAQLPHRTLSAIRGKAATLKLPCTRGSTTGLRFARRYPPREDIDTAIREGYMHATAKGAIKALAERLARPYWWVQKRATALGVTRSNRTRVDCWSSAELAIVEEWASCTLKVICAKLRRAGYRRTEAAVAVKLKRLRIDRHDPDRWSATELAPLLGVNPATVADWIERRELPAKRETWGPNGRLMIERKQLRAWVKVHRRFVDLRRVDQHWFLDLLLGPA